MYKIVKETIPETPVKKIYKLNMHKIYVIVDNNLKVTLISDFYDVYGKPKIGGCFFGFNSSSNRCFFSDSYDELINKIEKPYGLFEFDSLKEFAEAVIKFGWKSYAE